MIGGVEPRKSITPRLRRRIATDFPEPGSATEVERLVGAVSDHERAQAAVVLWARGDLQRLRDAVRVAEMDWRDALIRGGLEHEDWAQRLDAELGVAGGDQHG